MCVNIDEVCQTNCLYRRPCIAKIHIALAVLPSSLSSPSSIGIRCKSKLDIFRRNMFRARLVLFFISDFRAIFPGRSLLCVAQSCWKNCVRGGKKVWRVCDNATRAMDTTFSIPFINSMGEYRDKWRIHFTRTAWWKASYTLWEYKPSV